MMIVKVGGGLNINKESVAADLADLKQPVVFVHGGRVQADAVGKQMSQTTKKITSPSGVTSTYTDQQALDLLTMTYAGLVNKQWVSVLTSAGLKPVGLSGADGQIWQAEHKTHLLAIENEKEKLVSDTFTGKVVGVNTGLIKLLLEKDYLPVITQPAISKSGQLLNTDNDLNVAVMAKDLPATQLVNLFEAPGLLKDHNDPESLIRQVSRQDLPQMMQFAQGTMKKKIMGAMKAFEGGVEKIYWGDSRIDHPIKAALAGKGTVIA